MTTAGSQHRYAKGVANQQDRPACALTLPRQVQRTRWAIGLRHWLWQVGHAKTGNNRHASAGGRQTFGRWLDLPRIEKFTAREKPPDRDRLDLDA